MKDGPILNVESAHNARFDEEMSNLSDRAAILGYLYQIDTQLRELAARLDGSHKSHYTVDEVAARIGRSPYTVRQYIAGGMIDAIRITGTGPRGRLLVPHEELQKLIVAGRGGAVSDAAGA